MILFGVLYVINDLFFKICTVVHISPFGTSFWRDEEKNM
jgi:hypothetical protein